jgi:ATP-dependent Clp protease ATP-binding subunit ClpC
VRLTPGAKRVIELTVEETRRLGHDHIGTEHLLLGLLRAEEGRAAGVLAGLGVEVERVRHEVLRLTGGGSPPRPAEPAV